MEKIFLNNYEKEATCTYRNETYSVRDNGAVLRHPRKNWRIRPTDNQWTFGKPNKKTGYMEIASARVHRIVAFAFHGDPPTKQHIVDHLDTNKRNNRPENLRWVTKLENVLLNPITVKRIELACRCSIEEFLKDPSKFRDKFQEPNYAWMSTVSAEEAQTSLKRMQDWAKSDKLPTGGSIGEWIFNRNLPNQNIAETPKSTNATESKTFNAIQKNWITPSEFPFCPVENSDNPIRAYYANLKIGEVFSRNQYSNSVTLDFAISEDKKTLFTMCINSDDNAVKPWTLAQVTYENDLFVHTNLGSFFEKIGAEKQFTLAQGLEWTGEDSIDDYT